MAGIITRRTSNANDPDIILDPLVPREGSRMIVERGSDGSHGCGRRRVELCGVLHDLDHKNHQFRRLLSGDMEADKRVLRDDINATVGFEALGAVTDKSPKRLMRMFGPKGNPQARNLLDIVAYLQEKEGLHFELRASRR